MKMDGSKSPVDALREEVEEMKRQRQEFVDGASEDSDDNQETNESSIEETNETSSQQTPREETVDYWKHRFDVVQGQQRADAQRSKDMIAGLQEQIEELRQNQNNSSSTNYTSVEEAIDELQEQYGEDFTKSLDARIERMAKRLIREETASVNQELTTVRNSQKLSEQQVFEEGLSKQAPNWQVTNTDPEFVSWLNGSVENLSGLSFYTILINAYNNRELNKVAQIFNMYTQLKNKNTTTPRQASAEQQSLIAPPKRGSQTSSTLDNNQGKVFTRSEIDSFYTSLQQGKYKGKDDFVKQMKAAIHQANLEGRIV